MYSMNAWQGFIETLAVGAWSFLSLPMGSRRHYFSRPGSPDSGAACRAARSTGSLSGNNDQAEWLLHGALLKV